MVTREEGGYIRDEEMKKEWIREKLENEENIETKDVEERIWGEQEWENIKHKNYFLYEGDI